MKLTLEALTVLDAIDRRGSFAAAAEELHRVPSAITYTVQKLETDLGVRVFDRSGHRARLTPAGQRLLAEGRQLLLMAGKLERMVKRVASGWEAELAIAVGELVPMAGIMTLLEEFFQEPRSTRLRILAESRAGTWEALVSGRADLVIGAVGDAPPAAGYVSRPLGYVDLVFVVAPGHPLASAP
ncbi:MAG: LysR family transcriptional regulator, partial [Pseudomonadota bacterium]|nr:LysR family transcriptional regulator [Pseudomonadota bacterium]